MTISSDVRRSWTVLSFDQDYTAAISGTEATGVAVASSVATNTGIVVVDKITLSTNVAGNIWFTDTSGVQIGNDFYILAKTTFVDEPEWQLPVGTGLLVRSDIAGNHSVNVLYHIKNRRGVPR